MFPTRVRRYQKASGGEREQMHPFYSFLIYVLLPLYQGPLFRDFGVSKNSHKIATKRV